MGSQKHHAYYLDNETADVADMHEKFDFTRRLKPSPSRRSVLYARADFLKEEVSEFREAVNTGDFLAQIDALIDIVVVAKGTAVIMGLKWGRHWNEVHRANMEKERGNNPKRPDLREDLIKPHGWCGPDHKRVLENYRR